MRSQANIIRVMAVTAVLVLGHCLTATAGTNDVYWIPTDLADLAVWLDASDTNTLWADAAGATQATTTVARWDDKSGNGNHMLQTNNTAWQPITGSRTISNINALVFDGDNDYMQEEANAFGGKIENALAIMVFERDGVDSRGDGYIALNWDTWECCGWGWDAPDAMFRYWANGASLGIRDYTNTFWGVPPLQGRTAMLGLYSSEIDNRVQIWVDGALGDEDAYVSDVSTTEGIRIGRVQESGTEFDGLIAEVVIIDGTVSTQERENVEGYLAWKWDFVHRLSSDHLNKYSIPGAPMHFSNLGASNVTTTNALLYATTNTTMTSVAVVWDTSDKGTNMSSWAGTNTASGSSPGLVSATATNLTADTLYYFRFYGEDSGAPTNGWCAAGTFASAMSASQAPAFTVATTTYNSVTLQWTDNAVTETGYILQRSTNGVDYADVTVLRANATDLPANTTNYLDQAVVLGRTYYYRLCATNSENGSSTDLSSCQTNATTPSALPAGMIFYESFEDPWVDGHVTTLPTGWVKDEELGTGSVGLDDTVGYPPGGGSGGDVYGATGDQYGWVGRYGGRLVTTSAVLSSNLEAHVNYTLTWDGAVSRDDGYAITEILAGTNVIAASTNVIQTVNDLSVESFSMTHIALPDDPYLGEMLSIRLSTFYSITHNLYIFWDNMALYAASTTNDFTAPTPSPMAFIDLPTSSVSNSITMMATNAVDSNMVQYFFSNTVNGNVSGWQESQFWTDTGLTPWETYSYKVKARDKSANTNETSWSSEESAQCEPHIILYESFEVPSLRTKGSDAQFSDSLWFLPPEGWYGDNNNYQRMCLDGVSTFPTTTPFGEHFPVARGGYIETVTNEAMVGHVLQADYTYRVTYNTGGAHEGTPGGVLCSNIVSLFAGTTMVASNTTAPTLDDFSETNMLEFTPSAGHPNLGEPIKVRFERGSAASWQYFSIFDNIKVYEMPQERVINTYADNITGTSADLLGSLDTLLTNFNVYVYWSTSNNNGSAEWFADGTASNAFIGSYTNIVGQPLSNAVSSLSMSTAYYYTFMATNDSSSMWPTTNATFMTLGIPYVNSSTGGTAVSETSATIRGELTNGARADAWICWGFNDGGTNSTTDWENVVSMGTVTQDVEFSTLASDLTTNATYWYRCYVSNALGTDWSDTATTFNGTPVSAGGSGGGGTGVLITVSTDTIVGFENTTIGGNSTDGSNYPGAEDPPKAIDGNTGTKYLNNGEVNSGFYITPGTGTTLLTDVRVYTANDQSPRDPLTVSIEGANGGTLSNGSSWTLISSNVNLGIDADPGRQTAGPIVSVGGSTAYTSYRIIVQSVRDEASANSAQYSEFELYGIPGGGAAAIANQSPTGISSNQAVFNATLSAGSTNYDVYVHWGLTDGGTNSGSWTTNYYVGSWTNVESTNIGYLAAGLTGGKTNWYTFRATNDATNIWAEPSWTFATLGEGDLPPEINNALGTTNITTNSAVFHASLTSTGTAETTVFVYYGVTDGGTNAGAWQYTNNLGLTAAGAIATNIGGLLGSTNYYYRFYASNIAGGVWAPTSKQFMTAPWTLPFYEYFETLYAGDLQGQHGWQVSATNAAIVQGTTYYAGTQACQVTSSDTNGMTVRHDFQENTYSNDVYVDVRSKVTYSDGPGDIATNATVVFYVNSSSNIVVYDGSSVSILSGTTVTNTEWTQFTAHMMYTNRTWELSMNGVSVATNLSFYDTNQASLSWTRMIEYGTNASSYVDNFFVTEWLVGPLAINNANGATNILGGAGTAYLCGVLSGALANVTIYWGTSDGTTNVGGWTTSTTLSDQMPGGFSSQISGMSPDTAYYYRCYATNADGFAWASESSLLMARTMTKGGWALMSSPVDYGAGQNRLNGLLGTNLMTGLTGGDDSATADSIWYMDLPTTNWHQYWLSTNNTWMSNSDPATLEIPIGHGFWMKRYNNGPDTDYIEFAGNAPTSSVQMTFTPSNWVVFAWPYSPRAESAGTDRGWGFGAAAGSTKSYNWHYADNIVGYSPSSFMIYLSTNNAWNTRSTANPAPVSLVPGRAYYYYHRGSGNLLWTAPKN